MKIRLLFVFVSSFLSGLVWDLGSDLGLIFVHLIYPCIIALLIALLFFNTRSIFQNLLLSIAVIVSHLVQLIAYALSVSNGLLYITSDGETQLVIVASLLVSLVLAVLFLVIFRKIRQRITAKQ